MNFLTILNQSPFLLYDGPMETRIEYNTSIKLENDVSIFRLVYQKEGREALTKFYAGDIEVVKKYNSPIILNAPTWRASFDHIQRAGYQDKQAVKQINQDCISFVKNIRNQFLNQSIFITAPIGPKLLDYKPD